MDLLLAIEDNGSESKITSKLHEVLALKKASFVVPASTDDPLYATKKQDADFLEFHNIRTLHKTDEARTKAWPLSSPEESKFKTRCEKLNPEGRVAVLLFISVPLGWYRDENPKLVQAWKYGGVLEDFVKVVGRVTKDLVCNCCL